MRRESAARTWCAGVPRGRLVLASEGKHAQRAIDAILVALQKELVPQRRRRNVFGPRGSPVPNRNTLRVAWDKTEAAAAHLHGAIACFPHRNIAFRAY